MDNENINEFLYQKLRAIIEIQGDSDDIQEIKDLRRLTNDPDVEEIKSYVLDFYDQKYQQYGSAWERFERQVMLQYLDRNWILHIDYLHRLRQSIGLRGVANRDPLVEYKIEANQSFNRALMKVKEEVVRFLMLYDPEKE
jgi:preprotein translocase subunit SecA